VPGDEFLKGFFLLEDILIGDRRIYMDYYLRRGGFKGYEGFI